MFVIVKIASNLAIGTVVSYDENNQVWNTASNSNSMIGVIEREPVENENNEWLAQVRFSDSTVAIADRDIPEEGGNLCVLNGRVFVDNDMQGCGIVAPNVMDQAPRTEGDLIMISIR